MPIVTLDAAQPSPGAVVTVGTFDGVHVGHQEVVRYLVDRARTQGVPGRVVTFHPHPREVVRGDTIPLLTTVEERAEKLAQLGIETTIVIPFTPEFAALSAEAFVVDVLVGRLKMGEIVIGYDHGFGRGRSGDAELLRALGEAHFFAVDVIPPHLVEKHAVSSSLIREVLAMQGDVDQAQKLLGAPYALSGKVVQGDQRGRLLGFPTANLAVDARKLLPLRGVYAVRVCSEAGTEIWPGMLNIGSRPTFDGVEQRIEVHLLGFSGDLYGDTLRIEFIERLRDEQRFDGIEALKRQLREDAQRCTRLLRTVA